MSKFRLIDLFAGCGGMSLGFERSGSFAPVFAVEHDKWAAETYESNLPGDVHCGGIEELNSFPRADVVVGGPPCQAFSNLNRHVVGPERREMWRHFVRCLEDSGARAFVMENVPQLLDSPEFLNFKRTVTKLGFQLDAQVLNAADYGVPQVRRRAIAVGLIGEQFTWPEPSHGRANLLAQNREPWSTFRTAVDGLDETPDGINWHRARNPTALSLERYATIPDEGEGRFELALRRPDITPRCWLEKPTGTTDVFGRLWWDRPAPTIRTEFYKPEKGRYLHPSQHRPITVREAARLQGFPDDFRFSDDQSMTSVGRQVGNAVPPALAQVVAGALADALDGNARQRSAILDAAA